jgi:hypothetical protein
MKKILLILCILFMLLTPLFSGVSENGAPLLGAGLEINVSNCFQTTGTWYELDLSAYTSNKRGKVFLVVEVLSMVDDGTEWVTCKFRTKGQPLWEPLSVMTRYCEDNQNPETTREKKGLIEVWTDTDGCIEWCHEYNQPYIGYYNKTVTLQITIMFNVN